MTDTPPRDPETGQFMSANAAEPIRANEDFASGIRLGIAAQLGHLNSFDDDSDTAVRDTWQTFGWPKDPSDTDFLALYLRNAFARVVVDKPAFTTWRDAPTVAERDSAREVNDKPETDFEQAVQRLDRTHDFWTYCQRVDRVAGVAEHGALAVSFSDVVGDMDAWQTDAREAGLTDLDDIKSFKPLLQTQIDDIDWGGPDSERWGEPEFYHVDWSDDIDDESEGERGPFKVHWTRLIDVPATRLLDDETLARPRVEPVLNNLLDIEKTLGSAAEQSYRGADYGLHLNWDPEKVDVSKLDSDEVQSDLQRWYHNLDPTLRTFGADLNQLGGEMQDPTGLVDNNLKAIYAETGIPKREFIGNQQGEQSGAEQDEQSYFGVINERREHYAGPYIARRSLDRLGAIGILDTPSYSLLWPDLSERSESDTAEIQSNRANVVQVLQMAVPEFRGQVAIDYVETGTLPDDLAEQVGNADLPGLDESNAAVQEQFDRMANVEDVPADD